MLNKEEHRRYSRQTILPEIGIAGQLKMKSAKVLVIGAGGLGCVLLQYLAAAGVGTIGIVDDDVVSLTNLHRQILYHTADIGKLKALVAAERLTLLNPDIRVTSYNLRIEKNNIAGIVKDYDLVLDGTDNFATRYLINDACTLLRKPLIFAAVS
ncbi:MAG: HesA/MoeB/ThiF family protein, partial [Pedobacter sp.]